MMRIIDGRTIEIDCDSCACTFTATRGEDGEPAEILCSECKRDHDELLAELMKERDRVWLETFLSFPFKQLLEPRMPACEWCGSPDHLTSDCPDMKAWGEYQDLMDAADQLAYYSPKWEENR